MLYEPCPGKSGIRERDSEFSFILEIFSFGKIDEILHSLDKLGFGDLSVSIVFTDDLERTIVVIRKIVAAICFSISCRYHQRSRKIICETDAIHGIIPSCAGVCCGDAGTQSTAPLIDKILLIYF